MKKENSQQTKKNRIFSLETAIYQRVFLASWNVSLIHAIKFFTATSDLGER